MSRSGRVRSRITSIARSGVIAATCIAGLGLLGFAEAEESTAHVPETVDVPYNWSGAKTIGGKEAPGYVAFTFDDGPDLETTPVVLETLETYGIPATFFVVGRHFAKPNDTARAGAELLRDMERRGFTIGNHTSNHQNLAKATKKEAKLAVERNATDLETALGHSVHLFRPPFGATNRNVRGMLRKRGDTMVRWSVDSHDFQRDQRKGMVDRVVSQIVARNGGVVLFHDTKKGTARMLPKILEQLESKNCERIAGGESPILPVSLHYFLRERDGTPRQIPPEVLKATQDTVDRLTQRCHKRD